ncbi:unnamed protein product [Gordionus sp. m RMFG-2023]
MIFSSKIILIRTNTCGEVCNKGPKPLQPLEVLIVEPSRPRPIPAKPQPSICEIKKDKRKHKHKPKTHKPKPKPMPAGGCVPKCVPRRTCSGLIDICPCQCIVGDKIFNLLEAN